MDANRTSLDRLISEDPNLPSIAYQAHEQTPIRIPWASRAISLATGFDSDVASQTNSNGNAFRPSAFLDTPDQNKYQLDLADNRSSFRQASSAHAASSYEHMDFKGTLSVGNAVLGASGRAEFARNVLANRDVWPLSIVLCPIELTVLITIPVEQGLPPGLVAYG